MNSKTLVFVLFAAWSALCTRWYVCGIKEACGQKSAEISTITTTPASESESSPVQTETDGQSAVQPVAGGKAMDDNAIDRVQLMDVEDRVVINFPYGYTRREDNDAIDEYLARLAAYLKNSGGSVTITGHTDFVGEPKKNYSIGLQRAYGIRDILIKKGVDKSQIKCKSAGESKPVATNDTALGRYKNRRVEIKINN